MNSLRMVIWLLALIGASATVVDAKSRQHDVRFYEVKRFNQTAHIARYQALGKPWFELHPTMRMNGSWNRQPAAPVIKMFRLDGYHAPQIYSEVIWIDEVWTVDEIRDPLKED